jgi:hypothetical protein
MISLFSIVILLWLVPLGVQLIPGGRYTGILHGSALRRSLLHHHTNHHELPQPPLLLASLLDYELDFASLTFWTRLRVVHRV